MNVGCHSARKQIDHLTYSKNALPIVSIQPALSRAKVIDMGIYVCGIRVSAVLFVVRVLMSHEIRSNKSIMETIAQNSVNRGSRK